MNVNITSGLGNSCIIFFSLPKLVFCPSWVSAFLMCLQLLVLESQFQGKSHKLRVIVSSFYA